MVEGSYRPSGLLYVHRENSISTFPLVIKAVDVIGWLTFMQPGSPIVHSIKKIPNSTAMAYMGSLSKLCARTVSLFVDHRPNIALPLVLEAYQKLNSITAHVEADWFPSTLSGITDEKSLCKSLVEIITVQSSDILSTGYPGSYDCHMGDLEDAPFQRHHDYRGGSLCSCLHSFHFHGSTIDFGARDNGPASTLTPVICDCAVWWCGPRCFQ
jgi:hypothetical protein